MYLGFIIMIRFCIVISKLIVFIVEENLDYREIIEVFFFFNYD